MNKTLLTCALLTASLTAGAQNGANIGMGGSEGNYASLAEKVAKIEKKNDAFNVYFNYAASFQAERNSLVDEWHTGFANKQLRLEIKGNIGDHLFYRLRHRLNKTNEARTQDNFSKATDIMMAGWKFNDKWSVQAGKMCQIWGGFEFDENPMYIYQYSDMVDNMDNFMAGVVVSYKPIPTQEFAVEVSDANNDSFSKVYGAGAASQEENSVRPLTSSRNPLTYIANWNGSFADGMINTRWSWGIQTQARHKYSRMLILGQQLNLDKFQWYVDYMGAWDALDRLGIATSDLGLNGGGHNLYASDVHYNSFITKVNWQFAPHWNLMLKGMYETASVSKLERGKNYRKSFGYMSSVEYYPLKDQDFRVFLAYVGRKYDFSEKSGLKDYNTNRIELGFMYRIKAF
ncbi:porin [Segatella oris]|uniref:porin n=1 Tax=Segatella oris TaxID=28135 RepID=UPI00241DDC5E|nr:porin [Segatella oris]